MKAYIATLKVVVQADCEGEACDAISELLRGNVVDWSYLEKGHCYPGGPEYLTPTPIEVPDDYQEGDAFINP